MKKKTVNQPMRRTGEAHVVKVDRDGYTRCRVCGCTEREPCEPPCGWVRGEPDLCDGCLRMAFTTWDWLEGAHRPSKAALLREVKRMQGAGHASRTT